MIASPDALRSDAPRSNALRSDAPRSDALSRDVIPLALPLRHVAPWAGRLMLIAAGLGAGAAALALARPQPAVLVLAVAATTLLVLAALAALTARAARSWRGQGAQGLAAGLADDPDPVLVSDEHGLVLAANRAGAETAVLQARLGDWCADPARVVNDILGETLRRGQASREFMRKSRGLRITAHRSQGAGGLIVWRFGLLESGRDATVDLPELPMIVASDGALRANGAAQALLGGDALEADPDAELRPLVSAARLPFEPVGVRLGDGRALRVMTLADSGTRRDILLMPDQALPSIDLSRGSGSGHAFEDIPVALAALDGDGRIISTNRLARALLGLAEGDSPPFWKVVEGLGRPVSDWLDDAQAGRALGRPEVLRATLTSEETFVQIILRRATGAGADGGGDSGGGAGGGGALVAVISDATELKSLEARFVQSQKMQAIGQLAGGVAHDFNNLLTAISGHCDLLLMNRDRYDPDYNDLLQIHQNANRAAALVRQLLAFSRKQTLKPETFRLESLLEDVTHLLTRLVGERIALDLVHDPDLAPIRADRRQLEQVIMNLVVNARDAMPMGGTIRIETRALHLGAELEHGRARVPPGDYAVIRVIDEGLGIPPAIIDKIFEPFFTTKRLGEGTGLGLSTAYGIVKQMGGYIFADSVEGSGSTFTLYFASQPDAAVPPTGSDRRESASVAAPGRAAAHGDGADAPPGSAARSARHVEPAAPDPARRDPGAALAATAAHRSTSPAGAFARAARTEPTGRGGGGARLAALTGEVEVGGSILLVEDEAPVRAFAARALRLQGYRVFEAQDGEQALEFLADRSLDVDIFVTDVIMPGIDGPGWVSEALIDRPGTPVVFMSGYTEDTLSAALGRIPRAVFLGKPFSLGDLCETIARQMARTAAR